ncbi:MAG: hypothetical protein CBB71_18415 [Rhodopirellula sp. TMED11]|nr:MAG: hypothetical protein CBB71_18415 [Rhodopirellula sp. TMED11]
MPTSGLVITFESEISDRDELLRVLRADPMITVGVVQDNKCAIVLESDSKQQDREYWEWIRSLAGVADLQVAFIGFEEGPESEPPA